MTEYVRVPVVLTCNSDTIIKTILREKLDNLFVDKDGKAECQWQGVECPLRILIVNTQNMVTATAYDYAAFDVVLVIGNGNTNQQKTRKVPNLVYVQDEGTGVNFFLMLHATCNSMHLVSYDISDLLPYASSVLHSIYTEHYEELTAFARRWGTELSDSQMLVLVSLDYDSRNYFSFSEAVLQLLDTFDDQKYSVLVAENYNEQEGKQYYQGFVMQG